MVPAAPVAAAYRLPRFFLSLFIVFSPFTSVLALSSWLRFSVVMGLLFYTIYFPNLWKGILRRPLSLFQDKEDLLLVLLLCFVWISCGLGYGSGRSLNHAMAYTFTVLVYFLFFKFAARTMAFGPAEIARAMAWSGILCCAIVITDSVLIHAFDIRIRPLLLTGGPGSYNMEYFSRGFFRAVAGTAEEPGSMAMFLNIVCPVGLWHFYTQGRRTAMNLLGFAYVLSLLLVSSTAGLAIFAMGLASICLLDLRFFVFVLKRMVWVVAPLSLAAFFALREYLIEYFDDLVEIMYLKGTMSKDVRSSEVRGEMWNKAIQDFADSPLFGNGPGYNIEVMDRGYHSFFLTVLADLGIFAFISVVFFFLVIIYRAVRLPTPLRYFMILPIIGTTCHFYMVGDFYHAPFWMAAALVQMVYDNRDDRKDTPDGARLRAKGNEGSVP